MIVCQFRGNYPAGVGVKNIFRGHDPAGVGVKNIFRDHDPGGVGVRKKNGVVTPYALGSRNGIGFGVWAGLTPKKPRFL